MIYYLPLNKIALAIIISISALTASAQAPAKLWDKSFGGKQHEYFQSLAQTKDGGFILGGTSI